MSDSPDDDQATVERSQLKDQLMNELYPEFSKRVAPEQMEELIAAELARWDATQVRTSSRCSFDGACAHSFGSTEHTTPD
jgi:hypothetical protein